MFRMRTLIALAAVAALTGNAFAGVLPVTGNFCGSGDNADIILDSDGIRGNEDGCTFGKIVSSGHRWWVVTQECSNTADEPKTKIEIKGGSATVSNYWKPDASYQTPFVLHRCN